MTNQTKRNSTVSGSNFGTEFENNSSQNVFFNTCFDKNHLKTLIAWFLEQYGEKVTVDLVETLKQVGFHQATRAGVSLGVDDLKIPPQKNTLLSQASLKMSQVNNAIQAGNLTSVEKSQRLIDTWNQTSETLRQTAVHNFRTTNPVNPVYMMAFSGARGNISQVRQLVAMRGLMADPQGAILEFPIQSNFREGLTVTEYLISCYGARKGLVDTALRTATSGYLTRRLVDAVQHVVVHVTDCQTKKGIVIKDKNLEQRLIGRVLFEDLSFNSFTLKKNTLISPRLAKQISSKYKEIVVRSPLTCKTEKSVCQLCYGLDLSQGKLVSIGEAVGIIAAQSIGEPGTQLTMRTFHTGGVGVFSDQAMKSFTAPFEGKVEFLEPLSGLFVRTPHGNIVYLLKQKTVQQNKPLLKLTSFCSPLSHNGEREKTHKQNVYQIMHCDVPSGSLLWVKQGEYVKSGQLLLQASRLQTTTQEMPESSHPVRAPLSGEVFFESMSIRVVEEEKRLVSKTKKKKQQTSTKNFVFGSGSSQINQKEISPKFPTLIELGNFWVFSTFVQKEDSFCNSFFIKGDFVSPETPIQQYNLHLLHTGQLKRVNSSVVFGQNSFQFLFANIQYSHLFYFLQDPNLNVKSHLEKQKSNLLAYTSNSKSTLLTWYPFFQNLAFHFSGYCLALHVTNFERVGRDCEGSVIKNPETTETQKGSQKANIRKFQDFSYVWSLHQVLPFQTNRQQTNLFKKKWQFQQNNLVNSSCFIFSKTYTGFSKIGFIQFESKNKINWNLKSRFSSNFVKNSHKIYIKKHVGLAESQVGLISTTNSNVISCPSPVFSSHFSPGFTNREQKWDQKREGKGLHFNFRFLKKSLSFYQKNFFCGLSTKIIKKKQVWAYIPETSVSSCRSSQLSGIVLEPGKSFETLRFENSYVSTHIIQSKNSVFFKSNTKTSFCFYSLQDLLDSKKEFQTSFSFTPQVFEKRDLFSTKNKFLVGTRKFKVTTDPNAKKFVQLNHFNRQVNKKFCFYKQNQDPKIILFAIKRHRRISQILIFQKNYHQLLSSGKFFKQNRFFEKKHLDILSIKSPLFTKQYKTIGPNNTIFARELKPHLKPNFKILSPINSGWRSFSTFFKIEMTLNTSSCLEKTEQLKHNVFLQNTSNSTKDLNTGPIFVNKNGNRNSVTRYDATMFPNWKSLENSNCGSLLKPRMTKSLEKICKTRTRLKNTQTLALPGFNLFFYQGIKLQNSNQFQFLTFSNGWILPEWKITNAFLTSKKLGEFRGAREKQKQIAFSLLQTQHRTTVKLPSTKSETPFAQVEVGKQVRWGQELFEGYASPVSGQIIKITEKTLTLRKGIPLLASIRGLVHISHKDFVEKNDLLITLRSRRLQTEDIVQGIPKIEQLFEARETQGGEIIQNNMHTLLNNFFIRARQVRPFDQAVQLSLTYIQKFLVENILEAYSNQGVSIAEKHVEVVVRQMTARVRITHGGDSGFLPGEYVQLRWIEKVNLTLAKLGHRQAQYEPIILGITKSVLQSESFLVAASFQQVSKVLVRSALAKKTDFLRGLHENILVGQPIPAGTGVIRLTKPIGKPQDSLDISE